MEGNSYTKQAVLNKAQELAMEYIETVEYLEGEVYFQCYTPDQLREDFVVWIEKGGARDPRDEEDMFKE